MIHRGNGWVFSWDGGPIIITLIINPASPRDNTCQFSGLVFSCNKVIMVKPMIYASLFGVTNALPLPDEVSEVIGKLMLETFGQIIELFIGSCGSAGYIIWHMYIYIFIICLCIANLCIYIYMCVCVYLYMYRCKYIQIHKHTHIYTYTHIHICTYTHVTCKYMHVNININTKTHEIMYPSIVYLSTYLPINLRIFPSCLLLLGWFSVPGIISLSGESLILTDLLNSSRLIRLRNGNSKCAVCKWSPGTIIV